MTDACVTPQPQPITGNGELVFRKRGALHTLRAPNICPECGQEGYGVHTRWAKEPQYGPYAYFAHPNGKRGNIKWHYLGKLANGQPQPEICPPGGHCYICNHDCKGGTASKVHSNDFLSAEPCSSPPLISDLEAPKPSETASPQPRDKHCRHCNIDYPQTTERRCSECGRIIIMKPRGTYS